jgi:hypothetical protein
MMKFPRTILFAGSVVAAAALATTAHAASLASDNAAAYSGANNWSPSNGGSGFQPWTFFALGDPNLYGDFIGSSTSNGGTGGGTNGSSLGIDTSGNAWGLYGNSGDTMAAFRPFTGDLSIGQTVEIDIDQGFQQNGSQVGITLLNDSGQALLTVYYIGGDPINSWKVDDNNGEANLSPNVGFTSDGLHLSITLTSATTYSGTLTQLNGGSASASFSGSLQIQPTGEGIGKIELFNNDAGTAYANNAFFNNLAIVPEPSSIALVGVSLFGAGMLRRRKR